MNWTFQIEQRSIIPVYKQIIQNVLDGIEQQKISVGMKMPSIHKMGDEFGLAPGTIIRAYEELRGMGILSSKQGKGYFISGIELNQKIRVFLLFDRMNAYKEILYDSFLETIDQGIEVDVFFHHYEIKRFEKLIRENIDKYNFLIIMPHFNEDVSKVLKRIPEKKLILLDKSVPTLKGRYAGIYQNFEEDIYQSLMSQKERIKKYRKFVFSSSKSPFQFVPEGCINGFIRFCNESQIQFELVSKLDMKTIQSGSLYLLYSDMELINLLKEIESRNWISGKDVGIISYDDTPTKEILQGGISVLSTDFKHMGKVAASFVCGAAFEQKANPFQFILRRSV